MWGYVSGLTFNTKGLFKRSNLAERRLFAVFGVCGAIPAKNKCYRFEAAALVPQKRTGLAVETDDRTVRRLCIRNHVAADAGQDGHPVLGTLDEGVANAAFVGESQASKNP